MADNKLFVLFMGALLLPLVCGTPLDDYISKPDPSYRWHDTGHQVKGWFATGTWKGVVLNMTSQAWLSPKEVDPFVWTHYLAIVMNTGDTLSMPCMMVLVVSDGHKTPYVIKYEQTVFLLIGGGSNSNDPPTSRDELLVLAAALAVKTKTLAAVLYQVPNQPLRFTSENGRPRSEDDIIAYTWAHFLKDPERVEWPAHIPMTKATVRAMDTVQSYASQNLNLQVKSFVVAGASKRGWTTWLTGAIDKRVVGIVPMVMDVLQFVRNLHHFYRSYGGWPVAFEPYHACNLTTNLDIPEFDQLMAIVDPFVYIQRLTMPKLIISTSNDEFFLLDDSMFFWNELKGEKHLLILPNTDHSLATGLPKLVAAVEAFHLSIVLETASSVQQTMRNWAPVPPNPPPFDHLLKSQVQSLHHNLHEPSSTKRERLCVQRPTYWWSIDRDAGILEVSAKEKPLRVTLWSAHTSPRIARRDFRWLAADLGNCSTFLVGKMCFQPVFFHHSKLSPEVSEDSNDGNWHYLATMDLPKEGYGAFFVELQFKGPQKSHPFIFTTEAVIVPNVYPFPVCEGSACRGELV